MSRLYRYRYHAALILAVVLVFVPAFYNQIYLLTKVGDFTAHVDYAADILDHRRGLEFAVRAYMGWQPAIFLWHFALGLDLESASLVSAVLCEAALALVLFRWFRPLIREHGLPPWKAVVLTLALMVAAPVALLWPADQLMYLGYIGVSSYHNPSIVLLKPFAVLQFGMACALFGKTRLSGWQVAATAAVSLLATFAKPNLAICLLPALGLLALHRLLRKQDLDFRGLLLGIFVPVVLVLAWQFVVAYILDEKAGIALMPLVVMRLYSDHLALKFLASILFPAMVAGVYFRRALADVRMVLAWTTFAFGAAYTYLLAETGKRLPHGNFGWSAEIALFLLFVASMVFLLEAPAASRWKAVAIRLAFGLHVAFGIAYYFICLLNQNFW
jgi:hypothetical protein